MENDRLAKAWKRVLVICSLGLLPLGTSCNDREGEDFVLEGGAEEYIVLFGMLELVLGDRAELAPHALGRGSSLQRSAPHPGERWAFSRPRLALFGGDRALYEAALDLGAEYRTTDSLGIEWVDNTSCPPAALPLDGLLFVRLSARRDGDDRYEGDISLKTPGNPNPAPEGRGCLWGGMLESYKVVARRAHEEWRFEVVDEMSGSPMPPPGWQPPKQLGGRQR